MFTYIYVRGKDRNQLIGARQFDRAVGDWDMTEFTPLASLLGGGLIGLSAVILMAFNGRIAGISGIVGAALPPWKDMDDLAWRIAFIVGLLIAPVLMQAVYGDIQQTVSSNAPLMIVAGLLVGFGSVFGNGCTSGHGVCGLSRLSTRSLIATCTFMAVAIVTVALSRHVIGG